EIAVPATRVYCAVTRNLWETDRDRSERMFEHVLTLMGEPVLFDEIVSQRDSFPSELQPKLINEAAKILRKTLGDTRMIPSRMAIVKRMESLGIDVGASARKHGFITKWRFLGPFRSPEGKQDMITQGQKLYISEPTVDLDASYSTGDHQLKWEEYTSPLPRIDMLLIYDLITWCVTYAMAEINLPEDEEIQLRFGSFDGFKCWFNGVEVGASYDRREFSYDSDVYDVQGKKGKNQILIKLNQGTGAWQFALKVFDAQGNIVPGLD
ncbi:hypothetical protein ACFL1X_09455, partial [Candidatus Hydrogenedentota bacterium]